MLVIDAGVIPRALVLREGGISAMTEDARVATLTYLTGEFTHALEQLEESKHSFNEYLQLHPGDDTDVGEKVQEKLAPYFDPANGRAIVIQLSAKGAFTEIELFMLTSLDVLKGYQAAHAAADQRAKELTAAGAAVLAEVLTAQAQADQVRQQLLASALIGSSLEELRVAADALLSEHTELQQKQALLLVQGLVVYQTLAKATQTIDVLFRHRAHILAVFLETAPAGTVPSTLQALADAMAAEGMMTIAEHVLIEMIGVVPGANIVMPAVRIARELTNKVQEIKNRHRRGDIDDMLDLSTDMTAVRTALEVATKLFDQVSALANAQLDVRLRTD
jgi:hypothetical protein